MATLIKLFAEIYKIRFVSVTITKIVYLFLIFARHLPTKVPAPNVWSVFVLVSVPKVLQFKEINNPMAEVQKHFESYRLVWRISERCNYANYLSSGFKLGNSVWAIQMDRFHWKSKAKYSFALYRPSQDNTIITNCSFYLLASRKNYKFQNSSTIATNVSPGISIYGDKTLVCAFNVVCEASIQFTEHWLEAQIEELCDCIFRPILSGADFQLYSIQFNDGTNQTIRLKLTYDIKSDCAKTLTTTIHTSGLNTGQNLDVEWKNSRNKSSFFSASSTVEKFEIDIVGNHIEVLAKIYDFEEMKENRISEIAEIIHESFSDSLLGEHSVISFETIELNNGINSLLCESCSFCSSPSTISAATSSTTAKQLSTMWKCFSDKKFCDITIQLANGQQIQAHKIVLVSGSTVWHELLTNDDQLSLITVGDLNIEIIEALVTFIYTGDIPNPPNETNELLIAAETYGVYDLKIWCERRLIETITNDSAINLMILAHRYSAMELFEVAVSFALKNLIELKQRDEWKSVFFSYPELAMGIFINRA